MSQLLSGPNAATFLIGVVSIFPMLRKYFHIVLRPQEIWRISMKKVKITQRFLLVFLAIITVTMAFIGCKADILTRNAPSVSSTFPNNTSTGAAINGTISAIFNEPVDPATINSGTFLVSNGSVSVAGIITYDAPNKKAIFASSANLLNTTVYTATLNTGVKNPDGTGLSESKVWTFTTAAAGSGPSPVNLRTAANYVMLAKSAISTVPNSVITGDVGLSPAAESYMTGFSQTDATGYATSFQVAGSLYAADMAPPTSSNLTTAVEDMMTAYSDAAGRSTPDFLNHGAGEIGSLSLTPGLYKWTSAVTIGSDVTINGGANDVWIFQVSGDLTIGSDFDVTLSGGAQAKNIFWQVSGETVMGTGSHFEGIVLCQTHITMNTGSTINGKLLAQTNIAIAQSTVTNPTL